MFSLAVAGAKTTIVAALRPMVEDRAEVTAYRTADMPDGASHYLFAAGRLSGRRIQAQHSEREWWTNFAEPAEAIDRILGANSEARICVIGSESATTGSFDMAYAGSKAALELFVRTRRIGPEQQLVGISPGIIEDSGMTERREDLFALDQRRQRHPKRRFCEAQDVAKLVAYLLFEDRGFITGTTILINGGGHTAR